MDIMAFINDNMTTIIIIAIIALMTLVGYFAKKTEFGTKGSKSKDKSNPNVENKEEKIEEIKEETKDETINVEPVEPTPETLDDIKFEDNNTSVLEGDMDVSEDLYAPFGDEGNTSEESGITVLENNPEPEELKIEEVEPDNFELIEKDKNEQTNYTGEDELDNLHIAEVDNTNIFDTTPTVETIEEHPKENVAKQKSSEDKQIFNEISDIVDNTYVIENTDNDFDKTTSLKLDEINEKIKNIKLEDLDLNDINSQEKNDLENEAVEETEIQPIEIPELKIEDQPEQNIEETSSEQPELKIEEATPEFEITDEAETVEEQPKENVEETVNEQPEQSVDESKVSNDEFTNYDLEFQKDFEENEEEIDKNKITDADDDIWNF